MIPIVNGLEPGQPAGEEDNNADASPDSESQVPHKIWDSLV